MVSAPSSLARLAITGAAPVPVPPPRPVVTNTMSAPSRASISFSVSSSAASRPTFGSAPAPSPLVSFAPICSLFGAALSCSACRSVLTTMNSTPSNPAATIRFTALLPPPPTPTTLIRAPDRRTSSSFKRSGSGLLGIIWVPLAMCPLQVFSQVSWRPSSVDGACFGGSRSSGGSLCSRGRSPRLPNFQRISKELLEQRAQPPRNATERAGSNRARGLTDVIPMAVHHQPDCGGKGGAVDVIGQSADPNRRPAANRQIENLFSDLGDSFQHGATAGQHDSRVQRLFKSGAANLVPEQMEDLFSTRLQDLGQNSPGHDPRLSPANTGDFDCFVLIHHRRQRAPAAPLDLFRVGDRRSKSDGDVVGKVITADRGLPGLPQAAPLEV